MSESTTNGQVPPVMNEEQFLRFSQGAFDTLNATSLSRQSWFQRLLDPRRDYYAECGYPDADTVIDAWTYKRLYDREAIANRVVKVLPKESWQVSPKVYEDEDGDTATEFEDAWDALGSQLVSNGVSWYQDESGSAVWEYLARIDVLSGIGGYGILLLGLDDGKNLALPVDGVLESLPPTVTENPSARVGETNQDDKTQDDQYLGYLEGLGYGTGYPNDPNIGGTDQQYLGVQLGPTEKLSDKPSPKLRKLIFLRCYSEELVQIVRYEANVMSPRFGQPVMYRVTLTDPREIHGGLGLPMSTVNVHWSRVIHVADNLDVSEVWGVPRLRPVLNRIQDLIKLYGGSAEMYWKGAFPGISMETNPQLGGDVAVDVTKTRNELENLFNSLQRSIISSGMTAKVLSPTVVDPTPQINVQLEAICIQLGIPIRVFKGSERGELASSQDDASWNDRIRHRQNNYLTPRVVVPFIDRLILVGVLPEPNAASKKPSARVENFLRRAGYKVVERNAHGWLAYNKQGQLQQFRIGRKSGTGFPVINAANGKPVAVMAKGGYSVEWPDLDSLTDKDKAGIMLQRTQAYAAYVSGGIEAIIPPLEYMTKIDQMTEEEAESVIDTASKAHEDQETMTMPPQVEGRPVEAPPGTQDHADAETAKDQFSATLDAKKESSAIAPGGKPGTPKPAGKPPTANQSIDNSNPDQPRDEKGRFSNHGFTAAEVHFMNPSQRKLMAKMVVKMDVKGKTDQQILDAILPAEAPKVLAVPQQTLTQEVPRQSSGKRLEKDPSVLSEAEHKTATNDLETAIAKGRATGEIDPRGDLKYAPTDAVVQEIGRKATEAAVAHREATSVGAPVERIYQHLLDSGHPDLTPQQFRGAMTKLFTNDRKINMSGWSRGPSDHPRPDLVPVVSQNMFGYVHGKRS